MGHTPFPIEILELWRRAFVIDFPKKIKNQEVSLYNVQESFTLGDVGGNVLWLCAALSNQQAEHRTTRTKVEGRTRLGHIDHDYQGQGHRMGKKQMDPPQP